MRVPRFFSSVEFTLAALLAVAVLQAVSCAEARADVANVIAATVRITNGNGVGTGCVFDRKGDSYLIITNNHVAGKKGNAVDVEFWAKGYQGKKVKGQVVQAWRNEQGHCDMDIVSVPCSSISPVQITPIPLAPRGSHAPTPSIVSVGCPKAAWPSAWQGHITSARGRGAVEFTPPPQNGRSGSAICDETGEHVIGLLGWRDDSKGVGIAMHLEAIYACFDGKPELDNGPPSGATPTATIDLEDETLVALPPPGYCSHGVALGVWCDRCQSECPQDHCGCPGGVCPRPGGSPYSPTPRPADLYENSGGSFAPDGQQYNPWASAGTQPAQQYGPAGTRDDSQDQRLANLERWAQGYDSLTPKLARVGVTPPPPLQLIASSGTYPLYSQQTAPAPGLQLPIPLPIQLPLQPDNQIAAGIGATIAAAVAEKIGDKLSNLASNDQIKAEVDKVRTDVQSQLTDVSAKVRSLPGVSQALDTLAAKVIDMPSGIQLNGTLTKLGADLPAALQAAAQAAISDGAGSAIAAKLTPWLLGLGLPTGVSSIVTLALIALLRKKANSIAPQIEATITNSLAPALNGVADKIKADLGPTLNGMANKLNAALQGTTTAAT
jgi:hypothetical protein